MHEAHHPAQVSPHICTDTTETPVLGAAQQKARFRNAPPSQASQPPPNKAFKHLTPTNDCPLLPLLSTSMVEALKSAEI